MWDEKGFQKPKMRSQTNARFRQIFAGCVASFNGLIWGLVVGYTTPAISSFENDGYAPFAMKSNVKSLIGSISNAGGLIGNVLSGPLTAKLGRRRVFQLAMLPQIAAWILVGFSTNPAMMITGRVLQGAAADLWGPISQLYAVEIPTADLRDTIGGLAMFLLATGMFVGYAVGGLLRWDHMAFAVAGFLVILWPLTFFIPESPTYLVSNGRDEEAKQALEWLRGSGDDIQEELSSLQRQRDLERKASEEKKPSFRDLFQARYVKPLCLVLLLILLRQWTGIYAVFAFVGDIFEMTGGSITPYQSSMIVGVIQIASQFISAAAVKFFGKKPLAILSAALLTVGQLGMGVFYYIKDNSAEEVPHGLTYLPLVSVCVSLMGFNVGISSFPFVLMGELLPEKIRNYAAGICFFTNCATSFLVVEMFYHMWGWFHLYGTFWIYSAASVVACVAIILFAPDTRGKSLADLQNQFDVPKKAAVAPAEEISVKPFVIGELPGSKLTAVA